MELVDSRGIVMKCISSFSNDYFFLSNFYPTEVYYDGLTYQSAEAAFQAQKTEDLSIRKKFISLTASQSKAQGRKVSLRPNWDLIKDNIMLDIVRSKFMNNPILRRKLLDTYPLPLVEGNTWNDRYWGVCNGEGQNKLGRILERVRNELLQ